MKLQRAIIILLIIYALLTTYSTITVLFGGTPSMFITPVSTLAGFTFALLHAARRGGWRRALLLLASVFIISLAFETIGVATGIIYGPYHYTDKLGPLFLGLVPYLIPVAWFMMSYPSLVIADRLVPCAWKRWQRLFVVSAVGGVVMTAWDLIMDPIMVYTGHWVWDVNGAYHGIPVQNFTGWWLTVFTSYAVYLLVSGKITGSVRLESDRLVVISYLVTALGLIIPCILTSSGELALIGSFAMLPWVIAGWLSMAKE